ncbi:glutathione S-transferase [Comamonas sp.]|uniref:glutathione S-transferase family protein n=1 Tax=Comamonas sp. TaxID=34028 RepID=UPI00289B5350|nr:glutathione S-transferase [Comamonas sp.]
MNKLHCFKESGNSYKVALALSLAGMEWQKVDVDYFGGETRSAAWRAAVNEQGEVPVLEIDSRKMTQSGAILMYLSEQVPQFALNKEERDEVLRWVLFDNHKFTANLASYRWLRTFASPTPEEAILAFLRGRTEGALAILEKHLEHQSFVVGRRLTVADLSLAGYVFYPEDELGFDFTQDYPSIAAWMSRIAANVGWLPPYELLK